MSEYLFNPAIPSPCYVLESAKLTRNLKLMAEVQQQSGVKSFWHSKAFPCGQPSPW